MEWKYYNHAMIPMVAPHEEPDLRPLADKSMWKNTKNGTPLLARWTTNYDCKNETNWWYCIKDNVFDISKVNSKKRYEINKGRKNFTVKEIEADRFKNELFEITFKAFESWPEKYRPTLNKEQFINNISTWSNKRVFGAFNKENNALVGYAYLNDHDAYSEFVVLRVIPAYERLAINAAIVDGILHAYENKLYNGYYILDGARSINHETAFQNYLEKYFEFRKAYCYLHIEYNPKYKLFFNIAFRFKSIFRRFDEIGAIHQINSIIQMEEIARNSRK